MEWFSSDFLHALSPELADFTKDDITKIWESVSECYRQELLLKKTVRLMGVGTVHITENTFWYGNLESFKAERPVFNLDKPFLVGKKLPNEKRSQPEDLEAAEVIYTEVALRLHVPKEKVLKCIKATVKVFVWALSKGKNFDFVFKNVGILLCREGRVTMRFFENLLREVDKTGKLANAFLQTPRLRPLIVARTERTVFRMPPGGVFVFPHFVHIDEESAALPESAYIHGSGTRRRSSAKPQATLGALPGQGFLSDRRLPPIRMSDGKVTGEERKKSEAGVRRGSVLPPVAGDSAKKGRDIKRKQAPEARLPALDRQGRCVPLPPVAEHRRPEKDAAFHPGASESRRKKTLAPLAAATASLSPQGAEKTRTPAPWWETPQPDVRPPRARQVLANLEPYRARQEEWRKATEVNRLRATAPEQFLCGFWLLTVFNLMVTVSSVSATFLHQSQNHFSYPSTSLRFSLV